MGADALSDLLSAVHLSGSVFFDVTAQSPWVAEAPPAAQIAQEITPGADYALEYHVVTRGSCWISLLGGAKFEPVRLGEGDIAVIPRGDAHVVSSAPGMRAEPDWAVLRKAQDADALPFALRTGGDGPGDAQLICGFFTCDARPFNPLLDCLPRFIRFGRDAPGASHDLLDQFIRFAADEMGNKRPGGQIVLNRLSELLFVEIIRWHMDQRTQRRRVARRLARSHGRPRPHPAARAARPRLDAGGVGLPRGRLALGFGGTVFKPGGLCADPIPDPMAHAACREATRRSSHEDFRGRQ